MGTAQLGRHTASQKDTRTVASPSKLYVALKHSWPDVTFITAANKKMGAVQMGGEGDKESKKEQNKKREMK